MSHCGIGFPRINLAVIVGLSIDAYRGALTEFNLKLPSFVDEKQQREKRQSIMVLAFVLHLFPLLLVDSV